MKLADIKSAPRRSQATSVPPLGWPGWLLEALASPSTGDGRLRGWRESALLSDPSMEDSDCSADCPSDPLGTVSHDRACLPLGHPSCSPGIPSLHSVCRPGLGAGTLTEQQVNAIFMSGYCLDCTTT